MSVREKLASKECPKYKMGSVVCYIHRKKAFILRATNYSGIYIKTIKFNIVSLKRSASFFHIRFLKI